MRHFFAQFGPALPWPWTQLTDVPELTDELLDAVVAQSDEQAGGVSVRELERVRDDCLVAILQALREQSYGAGEVLREIEARLFDALASADGRPADDSRPLRLYGRPSARGGSTTTATCPRAATSRYSATQPTRCFATSASTRPTSRRAQLVHRGDPHPAPRGGSRRRRARRRDATPRRRRQAAAPVPLVMNPRNGTVLATGEHLLLHVDTATRRAAAMEVHSQPGRSARRGACLAAGARRGRTVVGQAPG